MGNILWNRQLSKDFFLMKAEEKSRAKMGQFYMVRGWDKYPLLSRPISVFDSDGKSVTFLYKTVGEGTRLLSALREGDTVELAGPYGNGFPSVGGDTALVGGGVGVAPLYLAAKTLRAENPRRRVDLYLGFSDVPVLKEQFQAVASCLRINVGGYITDDIDPARYDNILTCGPHIMMKRLYEKCRNTKAEVYVSLESRMACGVGVCLGCTCKTAHGNKKVCKDGPVFPGREIFGEEK